MNYRDYAEGAGLAVPNDPIIILKAITAVSGPNDPIMPPHGSRELDWEAELAGRYRNTRHDHYGQKCTRSRRGLLCCQRCVRTRVSDAVQPVGQGKGCDTFGPLGPWLATKDEVRDPQNLSIWLDVNGHPMQRGSTRTMNFSVAEIVSYVSHYMTLMPGDVIATGTPAGVGRGIRPSLIYLRRGEVVELGIEGLGRQKQYVL